MIQYIIAGLVLGGVYAISAAGLVVTYVSTGVMNFAFGSLAFFIDRLFYFFVVGLHWPGPVAGVVCVLGVGPAMGVALYFILFRYLTQVSQMIRIVATIGLAVALPAAAALIFGTGQITSTPGIAPQPVVIYHVAGVALSLDQIIAYVCIAVVLLAGVLVLRGTVVGLYVRAAVDSRAMTALSGVSPSAVAVGVWAVSTGLAALAGILSGPILNVDSADNYTLLVAAAFAAVVAARLRSLGVAVTVGLLMGVVASLAQWALPPSSDLVRAVLPSIPFALIVVFLAVYIIRHGSVTDGSDSAGAALDSAVRTQVTRTNLGGGGSTSASGRGRTPADVARKLGTTVLNSPGLIVALLLPLVLADYQVGLVGQALCYALVFLSYCLLTGEGAVVSLCQITFAGIGALGAAQLTQEGIPIGVAVLLAALCAAALGTLVGLLMLRMGDLYVALVTLTLGLLMSQLVFNRQIFTNSGQGVSIPRPDFAFDDGVLSYLALAVFAVLAVVVELIRRSTTGLALGATRSSAVGARTLGLNVVGVKLMTYGLSAFIASVGGSFLAMYGGIATPDSYQVMTGLVWFAVLVTMGARSINACVLAGLGFVLVPEIFRNYVPDRWAAVPTVLFGLGAIMVAKDPAGVAATTAGQVRALGRAVRQRFARPDLDSVGRRAVAK